MDPKELFERAISWPSENAAPLWQPPAAVEIAGLFPGYEVIECLGRGGMGAVYRARQVSLDRSVAIKILPFELGVREDFAERFRREATALARLSHPNIVSVHDFGQARDGHYYLVMEYVQGRDLAALLREGRLEPIRVMEIMRQVCDALDYAHSEGIIHRDIKPANVLIDTKGRAKVSDFGLVRLVDDSAIPVFTSVTQTGHIVGTPDYVAPEQLMAAEQVDRRADIYSLGVVLYEMLTGMLPRGVFSPPSQLAPVSSRVDRVVERALQSRPESRYGTVRELQADLVHLTRPPARGIRQSMIAAAVALPAVAAGAWLVFGQGKRSDPDAPFTNSLGQRFVPAGTPGVLFSVWETRVRDFAAFVDATGHDSGHQLYVNVEGTWNFIEGGWQNPHLPQTSDHPVVGVNWNDAVAFCQWLTTKERAAGLIEPTDTYRLPTDEEWTRAAGLPVEGAMPRFPWGDFFPPPEGIGNFPGAEMLEGNGWPESLPVIAGYRDAFKFTAPVGSFRPNVFGLFDLLGNASEWLQNSDPAAANQRIVRGGGWFDGSTRSLESDFRGRYASATRGYVFGFRPVLVRGNSGATPAR